MNSNMLSRRGQRRRTFRLSPAAQVALARICGKANHGYRVSPGDERRTCQTLLEEALFAWEDFLDERGRLGHGRGNLYFLRLRAEDGEYRRSARMADFESVERALAKSDDAATPAQREEGAQ